MLQGFKWPSLQEPEGGTHYNVPPSAELSLSDLLGTAIGFIRRQYLVVFSVLPLTIGVAAAYLYTTPPIYSAQARIMIDAGKVRTFQQSILGDDPVSSAMVDGQIEILRSENFALAIISKLHLGQVPELGSDGGQVDQVISRLFHFFRPPHSASNEGKTESDRELVILRQFENALTVSRVGTTYAIEIGFQSTDPSRAAQIANAVADTFIVDQLDAKYQAIAKATSWLQERLNELGSQASAAEHAVVEYKTKNHIVDSGGHLINEQQLSELNSALIKARAETVQAQARFDRLSQILRADELDPTSADVATVTDTLQNTIITNLRQQYLELTRREAIYSSRVGKDHLAVVNIRNQMREIRGSIIDELKQIAAAYKSEYDIAKARENSLQKSLDATVAGSQTTNEAQVQLRQLEGAAQNYRTLFNTFQQRYTDSVQQQSFPIAEASVITRATRPSEKSSPKSLRVLAIAAIGGLGLGLGLAMLREISDRVFRTSKQVEVRLNTPCIAMLPIIEPSAEDATVRNGAATHRSSARVIPPSNAARVIAPNAGLFRYVIDSPLSQYAEELRGVKVTTDLTGATKSNKVIGVTSSLPDEGKSTISASLAQLCSHGGARVILVDCDLRKRSLSRDLAPNAAVGLLEVITNSASLDEAIWSDRLSKLSFLPVVVRSRLTHTSEVLASAAMKRLFERLRESYDYVIVDLSPLAPVVDVRAATHLFDCYLFVVEWGKTKIDVVERVLNTARSVHDNLIGVILNKVDLVRLGRYDYNSYYARYGYYTE